MNLDDLQRKLIAAARAHPPSAAVPYTFEKRISARVRALRGLDYRALWARALWRAAAPCVGITVLFAAWSVLTAPHSSPSSDVSQDFENMVLAAADLDQPPADSLR